MAKVDLLYKSVSNAMLKVYINLFYSNTKHYFWEKLLGLTFFLVETLDWHDSVSYEDGASFTPECVEKGNPWLLKRVRLKLIDSL